MPLENRQLNMKEAYEDSLKNAGLSGDNFKKLNGIPDEQERRAELKKRLESMGIFIQSDEERATRPQTQQDLELEKRIEDESYMTTRETNVVMAVEGEFKKFGSTLSPKEFSQHMLRYGLWIGPGFEEIN